MAKSPGSGQNSVTDNLQTWILRVYIHCEGCKKKVYKVLQSIDGVYKTVIDSNQHKATVTGSVNGETLVQKLLKSGKHAEILPESFITDNASGNSAKKKKKQSNKQNDAIADDAGIVNNEKDESKGAMADGISGGGNEKEMVNQPVSAGEGTDNGGGSGKKKKNKKKKGDKKDNNAPPDVDTEGLPTGAPSTEKVGASIEQLNLGPPTQQTPYYLPPDNTYYPVPAYGVSYSTSYPSAESSYYTPPEYGYAQSHPSGFYHPQPPAPRPSNYGRSAFDDHDDYGSEGRVCTIM